MSIEIDHNEKMDRVVLRCKWFPGVSDMCKAIPGASWSKTRSEWSYPLSMQTLRKLRQVFGEDLAPTPRLWSWAKTARAAERAAAEISGQKDAELRVVPDLLPRISEAMAQRTYQRSGASFVRVAGSCVIADEPGLGKTITSIAALAESGHWQGAHLIVCPRTSRHSVWHLQLQRWTGISAHTMGDGAAARKKTLKAFLEDPSETKFLVINKEMLRRQRKKYCHTCKLWEPKTKKEWPIEHHMEEHERYGSKFKSELKIDLWPEIVDYDRWSSVIFDESHSVLASYKPSNISQMTEGLLDLKADLKLALTGTPIRGNELNMWGYLNWLDVPVGGYWNFASSYFQINEGFFGKTIDGIREDAKEELDALLSRYVLRRTRAEVRPDLPLGQRHDILVQMDGKHLKQYRDFERMGEVELSTGSVSGQGVLSQLTRLRQMAFGTWSMDGKKLRPTGQSPKIDWLIESFLTERGVTGDRKTEFRTKDGEGYKYIVASQFNEVLDAVAAALDSKKIRYLRIDGSVSGKKRDSAIREFNSNTFSGANIRILLLNSKAGGESIDLDAWCDDMVILDETFIADDQVQLEGRINNRSGRVASRNWWYVRTEDTIEQALADQNYRQHDMQHKLLDGRRGVELALHLIKGDG